MSRPLLFLWASYNGHQSSLGNTLDLVAVMFDISNLNRSVVNSQPTLKIELFDVNEKPILQTIQKRVNDKKTTIETEIERENYLVYH